MLTSNCSPDAVENPDLFSCKDAESFEIFEVALNLEKAIELCLCILTSFVLVRHFQFSAAI